MTPALVLAGGAGPGWVIDAGRKIGDAMPEGHLRVLDRLGHVVPPEVLAPEVLAPVVLAPVVAAFVTS